MFLDGQNIGVSLRLHPPDIRRRSCLPAALRWLRVPALATDAMPDAARRLRTPSRPCSLCETSAGRAGISRMVYGEALADAGAPR